MGGRGPVTCEKSNLPPIIHHAGRSVWPALLAVGLHLLFMPREPFASSASLSPAQIVVFTVSILLVLWSIYRFGDGLDEVTVVDVEEVEG